MMKFPYKITICLTDNDNLHHRYKVGNYTMNNPIIPNRIFNDIARLSGFHRFSNTSIIDAIVDALFDGHSQIMSVDYALILDVEVS